MRSQGYGTLEEQGACLQHHAAPGAAPDRQLENLVVCSANWGPITERMLRWEHGETCTLPPKN